MKFIQIKNCYKVYKNGVAAIADLTLDIDKGEFVFVIGASGSGKSTLIKMLYREEKPTKGIVEIGGVNVGKIRNRTVYKLRRKLGIVFQDFKLLPKLTVYENVEKTRSFPNELSGGEQQRVCIARAIVNDPKLLICDEPTGNLDPKTSKEIMKVLDTINKELGTTIVMATHDKEIVNRMKKRVIVLDAGVLTADHEKGSYKASETV